MSFVHVKNILISEAHLDAFGHLNNARYLELFEQARWDFITERGHGMDVIRRTETGPVILEANLRFLRELTAREPVALRSEVISYEGKIGKMRQQMVKADGTVACDGLITFGLWNITKRKLILPTPEWLQAVGFEAAP
ncbi:MAG: acyl-CoA thioesterase [Myxococcaceae bacterium]